jgi:DNA end-binding protein Ku
MAPRATWKGWLKLLEVSCPVALYTAAPKGRDIALHTLNRGTGHRVGREFVDEVTGRVVERDDQAKGYEVAQGDYVLLEQDEIDAAVPESSKLLSLEAFVPAAQVDDVYLDAPYYLAPSDRAGAEAFALIREAMRENEVAGIARTVLFRRERALLLSPRGPGLLATTLHFDYEVRSADEIFAGIPDIEIAEEMLDLALHIIGNKRGKFEPETFEDRYEQALAELIRAKQEGKPAPKRALAPKGNVVDLMDALRRSAAADDQATTRSGHARETVSTKTPSSKTASKKTAKAAGPRRGKAAQKERARRAAAPRKAG